MFMIGASAGQSFPRGTTSSGNSSDDVIGSTGAGGGGSRPSAHITGVDRLGAMAIREIFARRTPSPREGPIKGPRAKLS